MFRSEFRMSFAQHAKTVLNSDLWPLIAIYMITYKVLKSRFTVWADRFFLHVTRLFELKYFMLQKH